MIDRSDGTLPGPIDRSELLPPDRGTALPSFVGGLPDEDAESILAVKALLQQAPHTFGLPTHLLQPEIEAIYACGYYVSVQRPEAWSELVRQAKHPAPEKTEGNKSEGTEAKHKESLSLVCAHFCSFVATKTPLLELVDAVVAIPANPARLALRGMSLPAELGWAVQTRLRLPFLPRALRSVAAPDLQLRGMDLLMRPIAVKGSMALDDSHFGDNRDVVGRTLLLIDDVVCSGSTLREAARLLSTAGASRVYAVCFASCLQKIPCLFEP